MTEYSCTVCQSSFCKDTTVGTRYKYVACDTCYLKYAKEIHGNKSPLIPATSIAFLSSEEELIRAKGICGILTAKNNSELPLPQQAAPGPLPSTDGPCKKKYYGIECSCDKH